MIALVDYGAGNLRSVENALAHLGEPATVAHDPERLRGATAIILPGVGAAGPAMEQLEATGMATALRSSIAAGVPYLGICLGLQLLFEASEEDGTSCLGVLPGTVERLKTGEKLPHVGWNTVEPTRPHPLFSGLEQAAFYFVHSYVAIPRDPALVVGTTTHGNAFASAVAWRQVVAIQFHPERSGPAGLRCLSNFLAFARQAANQRPVQSTNALQAHHSLP